jgi:hypothetical protein
MSTNGCTTPRAARLPRRHRLLVLIFGASAALLLIIFGAAVMFFQLPPSDFLAKGFVGARAWYERSGATSPTNESDLSSVAEWIDTPEKTSDGFTLVTFVAPNELTTQAFLINMRQEIKHRWAIEFSKIWANPRHVPTPVKDTFVSFFACHLFPNGDLLAVLHGVQSTVTGYGLVKLDKDSNLLWSYDAGVHHYVEVGPDGRIYAIQHEKVNSMPSGLQFISTPTFVDSLIVLSSDGKLLGEPIPILEALRDSPYSTLLGSLERPKKMEEERIIPLTELSFDEQCRKQEPLHTNSVRLLTPALAHQFPGWKAGQLLITMRNLDAIAVVDPELRTVVWAARGPWRSQHDAQFLENGNLLLFDNEGSPKGSRILEYNPRSQAFPWAYSGENWREFHCGFRGMCQRLSNGNTLAVNSMVKEILEVTPEKKVVWSFFSPRIIAYARRYTAEQVPFLPSGAKPRP